MDLAKHEHVAALCLGTGEYLAKPFGVHNTPPGAEYLLKRIEGSCRQRCIRPESVLIGGEDPAEYSFNFIHCLRLHGFPFVRVNAAEAATLRNNSRAVSDALALDGIGQALVQQRGRTMEAFDGLYSTLKSAARNRRRLVRQETAWKNRIHRSVEILCPGFLQQENTGMMPFTSACLDLMEKDFSCIKIKRMRQDTLVKRLHKYHVHKPGEAALKLKALADQALRPPAELIRYESQSLSTKVQMLRSVREAIAMELNQMARCLAQTPGFVITSIPGIGVVLAGHIMAEYGCPDHWPAADNMASYPGIVPRVKQTGGPARPAKVGHLPLDANRILKDYLMQAAYHAGTTGSHRIRDHFERVENREGHSRLSTAKLLVRVIRAMVKSEMVYLPMCILRPEGPLPRGFVVSYYREMLEALDRKWRSFDLSGIPPEQNRLLKWKETVDDIAQFTIQHS
jgi:transposase